MAGDPKAVRVGPGIIYVAPLGTDEPADLETDWDADWIPLGYTNEGSSWTFEQTFEDVNVEEELDPIDVLQTARNITLAFAAAETTARNMQIAMNGGTITITPESPADPELVKFEPPPAGDVTRVMIGWQSDDGLERWVFRRCTQAGNVEIPRRRAPNKAIIPMSFRATVPSEGGAPFVFLHSFDYAALPEEE